WGSATGSGSATVTPNPSATTMYSSQSLSVPVTVSGSLGTPIGTVTLSGGGYTSSSTSLSGGTATVSIPANSLKVGSDVLTVTYSGDVNYASTTGTASVTV